MKFTIAGEHAQFFRNHQVLELEGLIDPQQQDSCCEIVDSVTFETGRDLWRKHDAIRKVSANRSFGEIAAELVRNKPLRLAYDQAFYSGIDLPSRSLVEMSCIQGIVCGLMLCLASHGGEAVSVFSEKPGNGIFFNRDLPIDFSPLREEGKRYLLIAYAQSEAVYISQENDPNQHHWRQFGYYEFGDRLSNAFNPIVS